MTLHMEAHSSGNGLPYARPACAHSIWNEVFDPQDASVLLVSGDGGTGKTHTTVNLCQSLTAKLHSYWLTNVIFLQKTREGFREVKSPHPRVRTVKTMRDFWMEYAKILSEYREANPSVLGGPVVVPLLDEWHKYMKRLAWFDKVVLATLDWWGENRKYQTVPTMITQKMRNIPRQLLPYVKWYIAKSKALTNEYSDMMGRKYDYKEIAFLIKVGDDVDLSHWDEKDFSLSDVSQTFKFERHLWTTAPDTAKVGQICYDPRGSANFKMGEVNCTEDWFEDFMDHISSCPGMMLAEKITEFFEEGRRDASALDDVSSADVAVHIYKMHKSKMDPTDEGHPVIFVSPQNGRKRVKVELNPTNLGRLTDSSQATLSRKLERFQ